MIPAPSLIRRNRRGEPVAERALVPAPVRGFEVWNRKLRAFRAPVIEVRR